ncbi:putative protein phosphatase 2C 55 [Cryptosporidium felis]|nr:putative protein phosphatase 2C 55 [Cryptosporidium felis]
MLEEKPCAKNALKGEMSRKKENERQEQENSEVFRRFLQELSGEERFGGGNLVRHSRSVLKIFSRDLPEKLYHSKRYTSQSTADSVSGAFSPTQNASVEESPKGGAWGEDSESIHLESQGQGERKRNEAPFKKALINRCFSDGLMLSHPGPSLEASFFSGEIIDLDLEIQGGEEKSGDSGKRNPSDERKEYSSGSSSIYRVMTSTTVAFPAYDDSVERLNTALKEDRLRRISTDLNKVWPSNVASHLKGIDLFLKIPEYIRPLKNQGGPLNLTIGSCSHPHPSKVHYGGEDAHFYEENTIGVADGVGEWVNFGINPKAFANELISGMREAYLNAKCMQAESPPNDVAILRRSGMHACGRQIRSLERSGGSFAIRLGVLWRGGGGGRGGGGSCGGEGNAGGTAWRATRE